MLACLPACTALLWISLAGSFGGGRLDASKQMSRRSWTDRALVARRWPPSAHGPRIILRFGTYLVVAAAAAAAVVAWLGPRCSLLSLLGSRCWLMDCLADRCRVVGLLVCLLVGWFIDRLAGRPWCFWRGSVDVGGAGWLLCDGAPRQPPHHRRPRVDLRRRRHTAAAAGGRRPA